MNNPPHHQDPAKTPSQGPYSSLAWHCSLPSAPSLTFHPTGFNFSTPSIQNQIHELAKTLPPPRKQNTACDACRSRKVKCNQLPGQDKVAHSKLSSAQLPPLTAAHSLPPALSSQELSLHQATSEKKRQTSSNKRPRTLSSSNAGYATAGPSRTAESISHTRTHPYPLPSPLQSSSSHPLPPPTFSQIPRVTMQTPTKDLLVYLFSPPDPSDGTGFTNGYPRYNSRASPGAQNPYAEWGDMATQLEGEAFRAEYVLSPLLHFTSSHPPTPSHSPHPVHPPLLFSLLHHLTNPSPLPTHHSFALDLVEVFFQIVHTRLPLLNPAQFRSRLTEHLKTNTNAPPPPPPVPAAYEIKQDRRSNSPHTPTMGNSPKSALLMSPGSEHKPLHNALVATVIAWGAKFSEHPLLLADRRKNNGQSMMAKALINRARELAEDLKVHRVPSADHVVIALLIEPMQNQNPEEGNGFHGFWLTSAIRLLLDLG
ncbi:hypothetical protein EIP91_005810, partial [Steccherinum ochraceum]